MIIKNRITLLLLCAILFFAFSLSGQSNKGKTNVYFESDKFKLTEEHKHNLDSVFELVGIENIVKLRIVGHTDNTADSLYNINLSAKRANEVHAYLVSKGIDKNLLTIEFYGQDKPISSNNEERGREKNRRVEIYYIAKKAGNQRTGKPKTQQANDTDTIAEQYLGLADSCKIDTTIILPQGTHLVFNRCEYLELKDCLEFTEGNTSDAILVNGITLADTNGFPIVTCGMLKITLKPGCKDDNCFKYPVKVRFPTPDNNDCDVCKSMASVWVLNNNGWSNEKGKSSRIKIIKVDGKSYYQMSISCANAWMNCDCMKDVKKVKIRTKPSSQIINAKILSDCPAGVYGMYKQPRKNMMKFYLPCFKEEMDIIVTVVDKNGDTLSLAKQPINNLKKRLLFPRCRGNNLDKTEKWLGFIPMRRHKLYRRYIVFP